MWTFENIEIVLFWISAFMIFWTYAGYPIMLALIGLIWSRKPKFDNILPDISLVITAYNEEEQIARKLENSLMLDYPKDKLEIIVASDGSTDRTDEIVRSFQNQGIKLLSIPGRNGKHYCQGRGIQATKNDLVVLSDATTFLEKDSLKKIIRSFGDSKIGCVSGVDSVKTSKDNPSGEGAYVRYEMKLRSLESKVGSLVGVSGCFFAVRKELCNEWIDNMSSDFYMPIITYIRGFRTVLENEAVAYYEILRSADKEYTRKVRTIVHGLEVFFHFKKILNIFKYGFFTIQIVSHKLLRWLAPFFMILLFGVNIPLAISNPFYYLLLLLQIIYYVMALTTYFFRKLEGYSIFKIPLFFAMVNVSIIVSWYYFLRKKDFIVWQPTER
ncbi:MAG: glycosyltransferase family 2 protein [Candidatus Zixiibacteriota bacterium]